MSVECYIRYLCSFESSDTKLVVVRLSFSILRIAAKRFIIIVKKLFGQSSTIGAIMKKSILLLAAILLFASAVFTVKANTDVPGMTISPMPKATPEATLDADDVDELINDLSEGLYDILDNDGAISAIVERWIGREDLEGKTRSEILTILFADVRAVVRDKATEDKIWADWNDGVDNNDQGKSKEQIEEETTAKKEVQGWIADAKANEATYKAWFRSAKMDKGFDPVRIAGFCFKMLKGTMDDKGCWSLSSFRGLVAYSQIEGMKNKDAEIKTVVDFQGRVAECEKQKNCEALKAEVTNRFEDFYLDDMAAQQKDRMNLILNIVGVQNGYDPDRFAGFCLKQTNQPDGHIGPCDEFVKLMLFAYWRTHGTATRQADQGRLNAFLNKTVHCSAPTNCAQIIRNLKNPPGGTAGSMLKPQANTPLDADGFYDYKRVFASCMSGKNANDANAKTACVTTNSGPFLMWMMAGGTANMDKALLKEKVDEMKEWLKSMGIAAPKPSQ